MFLRNDNYPPHISPEDIDRQFGAEPMSEADLANYIELHWSVLEDHYMKHINPSVLDDDIESAVEGWVSDLSENEVVAIVERGEEEE